jgi:hypothetical protein
VHKAKERAERVRGVADAAYARGGQLSLVVLTVSHKSGTSLAEVKSLVQTSSRRARQGAPWTRICERYGVLGVVVGQEVTLSRVNGWHYHQHLSVVMDGRPGESEAAACARAKAAGKAISERYKAAIRKAGGTISNRHGTYVRVAKHTVDAADYTAKGSLAWEIAGGPNKDETRAKDSLTPWDVAELASSGDGWARHRWREYMEVMPGTRSCVVSAALAAKLGITPADDDEGDDVVQDNDEIAGHVPSDTWRRWMRHGLASTFLARVERGGVIDFDGAIERTQYDATVIEDRINRRQSGSPADHCRGRILRFIADAEADEEARLIPDDPPPTGFILRMREDVADQGRASSARLAA